MPDKDYRLHCKDCDSYKQCNYYHRRRETSCICKEFQPMTGAWKEVIKHESQLAYECNKCKCVSDSRSKYCPDCGAKMMWWKHISGVVTVTPQWMNEKVKGLM